MERTINCIPCHDPYKIKAFTVWCITFVVPSTRDTDYIYTHYQALHSRLCDTNTIHSRHSFLTKSERVLSIAWGNEAITAREPENSSRWEWMSSLLSPLREMSWSATRGGGSPNIQLLLVGSEWISDEDVVWEWVLESFLIEDPGIQCVTIKYWLLCVITAERFITQHCSELPCPQATPSFCFQPF